VFGYILSVIAAALYMIASTLSVRTLTAVSTQAYRSKNKCRSTEKGVVSHFDSSRGDFADHRKTTLSVSLPSSPSFV
jgi:hypothetical protein